MENFQRPSKASNANAEFENQLNYTLADHPGAHPYAKNYLRLCPTQGLQSKYTKNNAQFDNFFSEEYKHSKECQTAFEIAHKKMTPLERATIDIPEGIGKKGPSDQFMDLILPSMKEVFSTTKNPFHKTQVFLRLIRASRHADLDESTKTRFADLLQMLNEQEAFIELDLSHLCLSEMDLSELNLRRANLCRTIRINTNLTNTDLSEATYDQEYLALPMQTEIVPTRPNQPQNNITQSSPVNATSSHGEFSAKNGGNQQVQNANRRNLAWVDESARNSSNNMDECRLF